MLVWFRLKPISGNDQSAQDTVAHIRSGRNRRKNNHLATFTKVRSKSVMHSVESEKKGQKCVSTLKKRSQQLQQRGSYCLFYFQVIDLFNWSTVRGIHFSLLCTKKRNEVQKLFAICDEQLILNNLNVATYVKYRPQSLWNATYLTQWRGTESTDWL